MCICACVYECLASVCVCTHVNEHVRVSTQCLPASSFPQAPSTGRCCHQHGRAGPVPSLLHLSQAALSLAPGSCLLPLGAPTTAIQRKGPAGTRAVCAGAGLTPFLPGMAPAGAAPCQSRACVPLHGGSCTPGPALPEHQASLSGQDPSRALLTTGRRN